MDNLDIYFDDFQELPTYLRNKNIFTFEAYVKSRKAGFSKETILEWLLRP